VQVSLAADGGLQLPAEVVRIGAGPHRNGDLAVRFVDVPMATITRLRAYLSVLEQRGPGREAAAGKAGSDSRTPRAAGA
jgi:hypothetical protein